MPQPVRVRPSAVSPVAELSIYECDRDSRGVAIPRPGVCLVVRFGSPSSSGVEAHAFGARRTAHRKLIRGGQRALTAQLHVGATQALLGVPASELYGRAVGLEELWGRSDTAALLEQLARAPTTQQAAAVLGAALSERVAGTASSRAPTSVARAAATRLKRAPLHVVAKELGLSERHLRRVFRDTIGVGPKEYSKLVRFHEALRAARIGPTESWASIAAGVGYYDQAHLIADFKAIAGVTPSAFLGELKSAAWLI